MDGSLLRFVLRILVQPESKRTTARKPATAATTSLALGRVVDHVALHDDHGELHAPLPHEGSLEPSSELLSRALPTTSIRTTYDSSFVTEATRTCVRKSISGSSAYLSPKPSTRARHEQLTLKAIDWCFTLSHPPE